MRPVVYVTFLTVLLSGCSRWNLPAVSSTNVASNANGIFAADPVRTHRIKRPVGTSYASVETTGSVPNLENNIDQERRQLAELSKFKANSPEWWALKKKIDSDQKNQNEIMRKRLTICQGC